MGWPGSESAPDSGPDGANQGSLGRGAYGRQHAPMDNAPPADRTPSAMLARLDRADAEFHGVLTDVRNRSAWDDTFVDALCEPPETFTFGGMFAHVITFNAYRRMLAMDALRGLGVKVEGFGCPSEYLASLVKA